MNTSLNQVIKKLEGIAQNHLQIKGFKFCDVADLEAESSLLYPLLWCDVRPSSFATKVVTLSIQISVLDIVLKDLSNERDVLSDCLQIISDVVNELRNPSEDEFIISDSITATPIKDSYQDEVAGWNCLISLDIANPYNRCAVPGNYTPPTPTPATCDTMEGLCDEIDYLTNEEWFN
jgi:hypothetical protein